MSCVTCTWRRRTTSMESTLPPSSRSVSVRIKQREEKQPSDDLSLIWPLCKPGSSQWPGGCQVPVRWASSVHLRLQPQRVDQTVQLVRQAQSPLPKLQVDDSGSQDLVRFHCLNRFNPATAQTENYFILLWIHFGYLRIISSILHQTLYTWKKKKAQMATILI